MKSPGTLLREAREDRGLTLDDVAAMTRVPRGMLEHLEEDRFEEYEAEVFVRGHLRNYAREMRLDVDEVVQAYERETGRRKTDPLQEARRAGRIKSETPGPKPVPSTDGASSGAAVQTAATPADRFSELTAVFSGVRRSHLVAVVLVLLGLFVMFGYLSDNQVTAKDTAEFEEAEESAWELEQDVEETRWLLEQSDDSGADQ